MIEFDEYNVEDENFYRALYLSALSKYDKIVSKSAIAAGEKNLIDPNCIKIIVKKTGEKIGIISFFIEKPYCHISGFIISDLYKGSGIGSIVLNELEKYLVDIEIEKIILSTMRKNILGIKFYLKNGYEIIEKSDFCLDVNNSFERKNIIFFEKSIDKNILAKYNSYK